MRNISELESLRTAAAEYPQMEWKDMIFTKSKFNVTTSLIKVSMSLIAGDCPTESGRRSGPKTCKTENQLTPMKTSARYDEILVVDRKRIFVILPKAKRELLKKVYFCRNTERTERSCFCQKSLLLQKETLSAGKSFHSCLIYSNFD